MKIHLLMHLDGGNRGCEAITKSTAILLKNMAGNVIAYTKNKQLDLFLGIGECCSMVQMKLTIIQRVRRKIESYFANGREDRKRLFFRYHYLPYMKRVKRDDLYLSTGGDMMCYDDNEVVYSNNYLHDKGVKSILWGCSMGKENATPAKLDTLKKFSAIYARESLSYRFFKDDLGLKNVFLLPDPAFILKPQPCDLPSMFSEGDVIGINVSNFILKNDSLDSDKAKQVLQLINHIIDKTSYQILLIPHVFWDTQDDRIVCEKIKSQFQTSSRISILNSDQLNYCEIRYVISKCRFFIGARTHSVISAYSTFVPTIALGYSIKSRGIAKDIGLPENLVVDFRENLKDSVLLDAFNYLEKNEVQVRNMLQANIPPYVKLLEEYDFNALINNL